MGQITVRNNAEQDRYEAYVDGELAGFAEYVLEPGKIVFVHTVVDPAYEGQGIGSALARTSLDEVRAAGERRVVPRCPFYRSWIEKYPAYADLLGAHHQES